MKCLSFDSADDFLGRTTTFLTGREAGNTILLGVALRLRGAKDETAVFLAVEQDDAVRLAAAMTPPLHLIVSHGDVAGLPCLIEALREAGHAVPGVVGPAAMAEAFADAWSSATADRHELLLNLALYRLTRVAAPERVPGRLCRAADRDADWLAAWIKAFAFEADLPEAENLNYEELAARRVADGQVFFWQVDGRPVSIAGFQRTSPENHGGRVNLVYTPDDERSKGYASACVAGLCQSLLDDGWHYCLIIADKANPTSNKIYRRLGYEEIAAIRSFKFVGRV